MAASTTHSSVQIKKEAAMHTASKLLETSQKKAAVDANHSVPKPLREKCWRVTHDELFSDWKLLTAADDWSNHSQGVPGTTRYRIANLPDQTGPGVYELGLLPNQVVRRQRRLHRSQVRVVYVGHSDNVRTRMQQYGQSGSHLKAMFEEVFREDYAVVFRWTAASTKADAAATETLLLSSFDYSWNVCNNHHRRHDRLLTKLQVGPSFSRRVALAFPSLPLARIITPVAVGADITAITAVTAATAATAASASAASAAATPAPARSHGAAAAPSLPANAAVAPRSSSPAARKQERAAEKLPGRSPGRAACRESGRPAAKTPDRTPGELSGGAAVTVCGAPLSQGGVCRAAAIEGRLRCAQHKGMRVKNRGAVCDGVREGGRGGGRGAACDGEVGRDTMPGRGGEAGRDEWWEAGGARIGVVREKREEGGRKEGVRRKSGDGGEGKEGARGKVDIKEGARGTGDSKVCVVVCGAPLADGGSCWEAPVKGRVRCVLHKGIRVKGRSSVL
ncbi:hypothetical protein CLOM_g9967 [Closterium sp. NIES-68]|nr:hypothetical protein CLOM_g7002 [Closterium sp. NIES-68]GJP50804.1 hypothetical protein CLOM_g9967 [Closterium sp. NIES-68]GJP68433.1 hypothetical protein CLOP_g25143 [Closterium sp. NIES-67]GJP86419.1 hypothetical protein CLOP_g16446 [Closterium sp. NIES-67]